MIGAPFRVESDHRSTAGWMILAWSFGLTMLGLMAAMGLVRAGEGVDDAGRNWAYLLAFSFVWVMLLVVWVGPNARTRCNRLAMGLPLTARRLWWNQTAVVALVGGAVVGIAGALLAFLDGLVRRGYGRPLFDEPGVTGLVWLLVSGLVLNVGLIQSRRLELHRLPGSVVEILKIVAISLGVLVVMLIVGRLPWFFSIVPFAVGVILILRANRNLPDSFSIAPSKPERSALAPGRPGLVDERAGLPIRPHAVRGNLVSKLGLINRVHRVMAKMPGVRWMPIPFMVLMGVVLSGWYSAVLGGSEIRLMFIALASYCALAFVVGPLSYVFVLDPLPISRRTIFALIMLPTFISLFAGYGVGRMFTIHSTSRTDQIRVLHERSDYLFSIPMAFGDIARDGAVEELSSPWGESHPAWNARPFSASRAVVYSPYTAPRQASAAFAALQLSRAVESIYGAQIPWEELERRYFESGLDGQVVVRDGGLTLVRDYPGLEMRGRGPLFPVVMVPTCLLAFLCIGVFFRTSRAGVNPSRRKAVFFLLLGLLMALHVSVLVLEIADWLELEVLDAYVAIQMSRVGEMFGGSPAVWGLGLAVLALGYRRLELEFARIESASSGADFWFPLLGVRVED